MVQPWYVKIIKFAENSPLLARNCAQNRKLASLTRIAPRSDSSSRFIVRLKSNTMVQRAKLEGSQPWTMYKIFMEKLKIPEIRPTRFWWDQFSIHYVCMACCMQNLSSIHRPSKKIELDQGLPWCNRGTWTSWNLLKNRVFQGARAPTSANSLRWRESPPRSDS